MTALRRCAVYTRKSSEEGLEQAFNSLHAQREACEAYIKSQAHEGWKLVKTAYDDGGLSGGTLDRPALQRLLAEVAAGRINVIVVYKVDRLTRSLADFARIVETLDGHGASFVSVTQQFNTTTSMGRLTLNVLLSFAQFEREVTGERIRDKVAASRRKGMWMGGTVPLGYDVKNRELVVNESEASAVREIFNSYVRLGTVAELRTDLWRRGILSKHWTSSSGRTRGGMKFSRGALYWLLRNPVYVGRVVHKGQSYEGRQEAIVEQALWERVQVLLSDKSATRERRPVLPGGRPLAGRLFDGRGNAMSPTYATKPNGRRYHYYVSQALLQNEKGRVGAIARVSAEAVEQLVQRAVIASSGDNASSPAEALRQRIERVVVHSDRVEIVRAMPPVDKATAEEEEEPLTDRTIVVAAKLVHRNRAVILDDGAAGPDPAVLKALCRAHDWRGWLERGEVLSYRAIASKAGVTSSYMQIILPLAFLAPRLTRELLDGRRRLRGGLIARLRQGIPADWGQQLDRV
jgi:DNA invertase Pin-like site-specific DNA recombinase